MQSSNPSDLSHSQLYYARHGGNPPFTNRGSVTEYCENREAQIERRIQNISDHAILTSDKETHFTQLVNTYLSDDNTDYAKLNLAKTTRQARSDSTCIEVLCTIPWTGGEFAFLFKTAKDFGKPSDEVTINVDDLRKVVTFYYSFPNDDTERFQSKLNELLKNDVTWLVDSLHNVIYHFQEHDKRLMGIIGRALEQRIRTVVRIQGLTEDVDIPESVFAGKLSVAGSKTSSKQRDPRYNAFKPLLFGQHKGQCKGTEQEIYYNQATVDHVVPKSKGGKDELDNLIILCKPCNNLKGDGTWEEYIEKIKEKPSVCQGYEQTSI